MPIEVEEVLRPNSEMSLTLRNQGGTAPKYIGLERKSYTIGRQEGADIVIPNQSVSREHARIFFLHDEEIIEDLNSTNGTLVNGVRVTRCVLQDNDIIRIGDATILFSRTKPSKGNGNAA
jgi:pSer/pThr/pTyr-binding forkhead associated (FHA) protein